MYPLLSQFVPQASSQVQATLNAASINESLMAHDIDVCRLSWKCWFRVMVWAWGKTRKWTPEEEQAVGGFVHRQHLDLHILTPAPIVLCHGYGASSSPLGLPYQYPSGSWTITLAERRAMPRAHHQTDQILWKIL